MEDDQPQMAVLVSAVESYSRVTVSGGGTIDHVDLSVSGGSWQTQAADDDGCWYVDVGQLARVVYSGDRPTVTAAPVQPRYFRQISTGTFLARADLLLPPPPIAAAVAHVAAEYSLDAADVQGIESSYDLRPSDLSLCIQPPDVEVPPDPLVAAINAATDLDGLKAALLANLRPAAG